MDTTNVSKHSACGLPTKSNPSSFGEWRKNKELLLPEN